MKLKLIAMLLAVSVLAGCQNVKKSPTQKEQATRQWNQARAGVLASLARSQFEGGNFDKSRQSLNDALALDPENAGLHVLSAKLSIEQGQLEAADRELALARKLDAKNAEAEYLSGVVFQRWQKTEMAYECYLRASQKNPEEVAYLLARAEMLVSMNCAPEALKILRGKLPYFEHNPLLHHVIGQLELDQGNCNAAIIALRQASILAPDDVSIREHLAMGLFQNKQYREAESVFARLLSDPAHQNRPELWLAVGECQLQSGKVGEARGSFDKATQLDAASAPAWLSLAKATLQLGDTRRAESLLRKAIALDPSNSESHLMLGYLRLKQDRLDDALIEFQKSTALDQNDPVSLCMVGYVLEKSGKAAQAMQYYAKALKLKPDDELAARLMASVDAGN